MPTHSANLVLKFGYGATLGIEQTVTGHFANLSHVCSVFHRDGVTWTHPKEEGFKYFADVEQVTALPKTGLLAKITLEDNPDLVPTRMEIKPLRRNGGGIARIELDIAGPLSAIETNNLHALRQGYRSRTVEDLYSKLATFAWAQLDGLYLRGGIAYDQPVGANSKDVYLVINTRTGVGKTALLLRFLQEGMNFVSNRALLQFEPVRDGQRKLNILPQYMPTPDAKPGRRVEAPVRILRAIYTELKNKGFNPSMPGVREYTEEDSPEVGRDSAVLGITSPTKPIPIDEKTRLIVVFPELSQVPGVDVARVPKPDWAGSIRNVWRAGWSLEDAVEGLNMFEGFNVKPDSRAQVIGAQERFANEFVRAGIFDDVAGRALTVLKVHYDAANIDHVAEAIRKKVGEAEEE